MTDEERKQLEQLEKNDLVEMLGAMREENATLKKRTSEQIKKIVNDFIRGAPAPAPAPAAAPSVKNDDKKNEIFDISKNKNFEKLKKRFSGK